MEGCRFKVVLKHCRTAYGWLYVQSCFNALQDSKWMIACSKMFESTAEQYMVGCMFKVILMQCRTVDGWLYVQSCFKALQGCKWMVVCSELF